MRFVIVQMIEVKERGEQVIRRGVLTQKHNLNERQTKAIDYIFQYDRLTIQDYELLCPDVNRRSLQRDLKIMIEKELIATEGATNQLVYFFKELNLRHLMTKTCDKLMTRLMTSPAKLAQC